MSKKKLFLVIFFLILIACSYFLVVDKETKDGDVAVFSKVENIGRQDAEVPRLLEGETLEDLNLIENRLDLALSKAIEQNCEKEFTYHPAQLMFSELLAKNIHFEKNGDIYTLREFVEDSANGSYRKLVYLKQDGSGLADIIEIPSEHEVNPGQEIINMYLEDANIKIVETDKRLALKQNEQIVYSSANDKILKFRFNTPSSECAWEEED
ncbi:hypothetical protein N9O57_00265 [bacterium]|nr:hypothetical protein [bacterium]